MSAGNSASSGEIRARAVYDKLQAEVARTTGIPSRIFRNTPYVPPEDRVDELSLRISKPFSWTVDELREAGASRDLIAERKAAMLAREYEQRALDESPGYDAHVGVDGTTRYTPNAALVERDNPRVPQYKLSSNLQTSGPTPTAGAYLTLESHPAATQADPRPIENASEHARSSHDESTCHEFALASIRRPIPRDHRTDHAAHRRPLRRSRAARQ